MVVHIPTMVGKDLKDDLTSTPPSIGRDATRCPLQSPDPFPTPETGVNLLARYPVLHPSSPLHRVPGHLTAQTQQRTVQVMYQPVQAFTWVFYSDIFPLLSHCLL